MPDSPRIKEIRQTGYPKVDTLLTCDPPEHKRYRSLVGNAFSTRRVAAIEDRIATVADELIDRFVGAGSVELVHQFAIPLPLTIIAEQLGVPVTDLHLFKEWSDAAVLPLGGLLSEEEREACAYKYAEMQHYFAARIAERRDDPQDDMLTDMVAARLAGERPLDVPELLSICAQFLVAGNETTTKLITACAQLLCQHPDQLAAVRDDPSLVPGAVEESLRMESAVQTMFRTATRDTELAGVAIPKGGRVVLLIGAANRDPATFPDPDRFDVRRPNARFNLGFAHGEHYCIGAALARAEATIGVRALLTGLPGPAPRSAATPSSTSRAGRTGASRSSTSTSTFSRDSRRPRRHAISDLTIHDEQAAPARSPGASMSRHSTALRAAVSCSVGSGTDRGRRQAT